MIEDKNKVIFLDKTQIKEIEERKEYWSNNFKALGADDQLINAVFEMAKSNSENLPGDYTHHLDEAANAVFKCTFGGTKI